MNTKSIPDLADLEDRLFEDFRDELRDRILEAFDVAMTDMNIPSDNPYRKALLGSRDEDLRRIFGAVDEQAAVLWGRGAGKHLIEKELVKSALTQDQDAE